jgi:hypothetical protein
MPTRKPRYPGTDADDRSEQLERPQRREANELETTERAWAVEETAGALSGVYEPGELERLREDWPD